MINNESARRAIAESITMKFPDPIARDIEIDLSVNKIIVIAGVRRSGKTYEIFNIIKTLQKNGVPRGNILYINFEDERFVGLEARDFDFIMDTFYSLTEVDEKHKVYLFFDEIQNIENWDKAIRRFYDAGKFHIFLTGSSSKLLSAEISTSLAGRNLTYIMYPFSFKEYVRAKNLDLNRLSMYSEIQKLKKYALEYITYGGFPEISYADNENTKRRILSSYYDSILFNDIMNRYRVADASILRLVIGYAINSYSSSFSSSKLFSFLKSLNVEISKKTVNNYVSYAENVFFFIMNMKFSPSYQKMHQSRKKLYLVDTGFTLLFKKSDDFGKLLENCVYIELLRLKEKDSGMDVFYFSHEGYEIDFIVTRSNQVVQAIQVCYDLNPSNMKREIDHLKKFLEKYETANGIVIVMEKSSIVIDHPKIKIISFHEWVLNSDHA